MKFKIKRFENCFGIKKLKTNFPSQLFYQNNIYSSNGMFKTSFSKAFKCIGEGNIDEIKDRISGEKGKIELLDESDNLIPLENLKDNVIVFSRELEEANDEIINNENIAKLAINNEQKIKYKKIVESINKIEEKINLICKDAKLNRKDFNDILGINNLNAIDSLKHLSSLYDNYNEVDISNIDISKINKKAYCCIDNKEFKDDLSAYINVIKEYLNNTGFDEQFNIMNYKNIISELKKTNYFSKEKGRGIIFKHIQYYNIEEFEKTLEEEANIIKNDKDIIKKSNSFIKELGDSNEARTIQASIIGDVGYVKAIMSGRRNILLNYITKQGFDYLESKKLINDINEEYNNLVEEIKSTSNEFEIAKEIFKSRFRPIFNVEIKNLECCLNGISLPTITFRHNSNKEKKLNEKELKVILSSGEKTTLRILGFIAEYLTKINRDPIIIFDDVIETFDYSNRYAFIEYIREIINDNKCVLSLTHNFDFYNTIKLKAKDLDNLSTLRKNKESNIIEIYNPNHIFIEDVVNVDNIKSFIASIPFAREAKKILGEDTLNLTRCLHYMKETRNLKIKDIIKEFDSSAQIDFGDELYFDKLIESAKDIANAQFDTYDIKKKTILSIASRLLIEEKIIKDDFTKVESINANQTNVLKDKYKNILSDKCMQLLDKVLLSTADYIHVNAFMYEPLIDIDSEYIKKLFNDIYELKEDEVWK